jgi:hypothetical protein
MRRSGVAICRHFDNLDAVLESDTSDDFRQGRTLIGAIPSQIGLPDLLSGTWQLLFDIA